MGNVTIIALKAIIALSLAGSLVVQTVLLPLTWADLTDAGAPLWGMIAGVAIIALGVLALQVLAVCVWQLLSLVAKGTVFSRAAFRYVDVIIGAVAAAAVLAFLLAALLAPGDLAPGIVGLICGASLVLAGVALVVVVARRVLAQAIERDGEVRALRAQLGGAA